MASSSGVSKSTKLEGVVGDLRPFGEWEGGSSGLLIVRGGEYVISSAICSRATSSPIREWVFQTIHGRCFSSHSLAPVSNTCNSQMPSSMHRKSRREVKTVRKLVNCSEGPAHTLCGTDPDTSRIVFLRARSSCLFIFVKLD